MSFPILKLLDPSEFGTRWRRARQAALRRFVGPLRVDEETEKLIDVASKDRTELLRAVFENSKKFGDSARWHFGAEWEVADFYDIVRQLDVPCFAGKWTVIEDGMVLDRAGCNEVESYGSFVCEYFKEAMDGLVMGLSNEVAFSRHESRGHGSQACRDLFRRASARHLAFGPLPQGLESVLDEIHSLLSAEGVTIEFPGQSEGSLFYRWRIDRGESCRDMSATVYRLVLEVLSKSRFELVPTDITPRAIIGPGSVGQAPVTCHKAPTPQGGMRRWNHIIS